MTHNADDVRTLLRLYDEVVAELLRLDPWCQLSGWDTNNESKPAVERVRAALIDGKVPEEGESGQSR